MPTWLVVMIVLGLLAVFGIGPLGVLAVYGVRKYVVNAKTVEARSSLGQIAKSAVEAYEVEDGASRHRLCPSASAPIPRDDKQVRHAKYMSSPSDWEADKAQNAGFYCLKFSMTTPQYYQYNYQASGSQFTGIARGDLDGDGVFSRFAVSGRVVGTRLEVTPTLEETSPEE
jgi:type IV pilus assembly protein PilA